MPRYVASRIVQALTTVVIVSVFVFALSYSSGDPALLMVPITATDQDIRDMRALLGTDKPLVVQYWSWAKRTATGDFGQSTRQRRPVVEAIRERLPNSLQLGAVAFGFSFVLAVVLGIAAAVNHGTRIDFAARILANLGHSAPAFWVAIMAIELFAVRWSLLPASGKGGLGTFVLPVGVLVLASMSGMMRLVRSGILEVLSSDYIRTARAKGLSRAVVIFKHALRNSLLPLVTVMGLSLAHIVTGSVIIETVFGWPGIGRLGYEGVLLRDYPMVQGVVLLAALSIAATNLLVDLLYGILDPRISVGKARA